MGKDSKVHTAKRAAAKRTRNGVARLTKFERRSMPGRLNRRARSTTKLPKSSILSRPAELYAVSLANPFTGPIATIPDYPNVPSRRLRVFAKGTADSSTATGFGFVALDPYRAATNDLNCITTSSQAYSANSIDFADPDKITAVSNSDYASTDFGTGGLARGRIVSAGIRVRYSGTQLNRGGLLIGFQHPTHESIDGSTQAMIEAYDCSKRFVPGNGEYTVLYSPVLENEMAFAPDMGGGSLAVQRPIMAFVFRAPSGTVATYSWEAFVNIEVNGQFVRGMAPSVSDPSGFAAVQTTAQITQMRPHADKAESHASKFAQGVEEVAKSTITGAMHGAASSVGSSVAKKGISWAGEALEIAALALV